MQLSPNCNSFLYGTYYGGGISKEHVHGGTSRYDKRGIVYQALCTSCGGTSAANVHQDFPLYPSNAWPSDGMPNHNTLDFNCTEAVFKINFSPSIVISNYTANNYGCSPLTIHFNNVSTGATSFMWNFGGNDTTSTVSNPIRTYTAAGTYTAALYAYNPTTCNLSDTSIITISVFPSLQANYTAMYDSCKNSVTIINNSSVSTGTMSYNWNFGNGQTDTIANPGNISYNPGTYTTSLIVSNGSCADTAIQVVVFALNPMQTIPDTSFCNGGIVQLNASGGTSYSWQPTTGLSNSTINNPIATPTTTTIYTVTIQQTDGAGRQCNFKLTDTITVYPSVTANFTDSINNCGNTVIFKDSSYANVIQWHWNFGDSGG